MDPPDNADDTAVPDQVRDTLSSNQSKSNTVEGKKSKQWGSTASATAKPLSHGAKESADGLTPLRSVIEGISGVEGSEPSQRNSDSHSEVGVEGAVETGPSLEGSNINEKEGGPVDDSPTSTPSISQSGKPNSM